MEDLDGDDDDYSDDDLDALPGNTLHKLQEDAIRYTQQPLQRPQLPTVGHASRPGPAEIASGFGRMSVDRNLDNTYDPHALPQASSDYGDFDDEMLDGEIFDAAEEPSLAARFEVPSNVQKIGEQTQREQWRQQRYGVPPPNRGTSTYEQNGNQRITANGIGLGLGRPSRAAEVEHGIRNAANYSKASSIVNEPPARPPVDVEALQKQVQKLLQEREGLQLAIRTANDNVFAKTGEISIVRANAAKLEKELEQRAKSLQLLQADEAARQKIEVERTRAELQKLATEKEFLENDLAEGTKQIRHLQKAIKKGDKAIGKENKPSTPKKAKGIPMRDGFDDGEVQPLSPSKLALRSKAGTPKGGAKRKRKPLEDSPVKSLEVAQVNHTGSFSEAEPVEPRAQPTPKSRISVAPDQRYQLTQQILDHRYKSEKSRAFEQLVKYAFPSDPDKSFSTILLDKMSSLTYDPSVENFPSAICLLIISIWSQCIEEEYHEPVHYLIDFVKYILELNPITTAPDLTNELMNLVQMTADIILVPRCQKKPPREDKADIDSTDCLNIVLMIAYDCQCDPEEINRFWRTMRFDFIMMLLNFVNPISEISMMLSILQTSILDTSFAMIVPPNNGQQDASEAHIIDNLSHLLINTPRTLPDEDLPDAVDLCNLRLEVLNLFEEMCNIPRSAESLAKHRLVVGYLVRVMNDELDRVYDYQYGHELRVALVNQSTRLLYYLTTNYPDLINMQTKLSVVPGGEKKYIIALTRLAFSEGGFYEEGIEDDVVDSAHQMLEARVSPEEAEGLVEAFSTAPVSRSDAKEGQDAPQQD